MPLPMRNLPPNAAVSEFHFGKSRVSHIFQISPQLVIRSVERHQLHDMCPPAHHMTNCVQRTQRLSKVCLSRRFAPVAKVVVRSALSIIATGNPVRSRSLASAIDLPPVIEDVNARVRRTSNYERNGLLPLPEDWGLVQTGAVHIEEGSSPTAAPNLLLQAP